MLKRLSSHGYPVTLMSFYIGSSPKDILDPSDLEISKYLQIFEEFSKTIQENQID